MVRRGSEDEVLQQRVDGKISRAIPKTVKYEEHIAGKRKIDRVNFQQLEEEGYELKVFVNHGKHVTWKKILPKDSDQNNTEHDKVKIVEKPWHVVKDIEWTLPKR